MINSLQIDWTGFKSYVASNIIPFKMIEDSRSYNLYLSDGALVASCLIVKDGGADQVDFEANYKTRANKDFPLYATYVNLRQSAATAANATVFAMRNPAASTRTVVIERIALMMSFDAGTPLGRSLQRYYLTGFSAATPTGGTAQTPAHTDSANPTSQVTDIRSIDTGLTVSGLVFGQPLIVVGCPASDGSTMSYSLSGQKIKINPGEGLAIRLGVAAVVGQGLTGDIFWSER